MLIKYIKLPIVDNLLKGKLSFMESNTHIPFNIKRIFYIYDIKDLTVIRGGHAHKTLQQVIFCLNGSFTLELDNGNEKEEIYLNKPNEGVIIEAKIWLTMKKFSKRTIIMVIASDYYDEIDYIRNYKEFRKYIKRD
ncbi:MAG TPA: WxcM-like domain-containing protein [Candidatus Atribacteria bacterium]|nr:WxcM-like domain-containing protein [Candidatus Atribacteria bacterium]